MKGASASGSPTAPDKLGILVELQMRVAFVESKIQAAEEDYERAATLLGQELKQKILTITWTVLAEEFHLFLTDFRDSECLLSGEIALLDYRRPA
jgi:hypothetical protein